VSDTGRASRSEQPWRLGIVELLGGTNRDVHVSRMRIAATIGSPRPRWRAVHWREVRNLSIPDDVLDAGIATRPNGLGEHSCIAAAQGVVRDVAGRNDTDARITNPRIVIRIPGCVRGIADAPVRVLPSLWRERIDLREKSEQRRCRPPL
jgi:hypothetical protein